MPFQPLAFNFNPTAQRRGVQLREEDEFTEQARRNKQIATRAGGERASENFAALRKLNEGEGGFGEGLLKGALTGTARELQERAREKREIEREERRQRGPEEDEEENTIGKFFGSVGEMFGDLFGLRGQQQ